MLHCPRCASTLPYWLPRHRRRIKKKHAGVALSKDCPTCGIRTVRHRSPVWMRAIRAVLGDRMSYRACVACAWHGASLHGRPEMEPAPA